MIAMTELSLVITPSVRRELKDVPEAGSGDFIDGQVGPLLASHHCNGTTSAEPG